MNNKLVEIPPSILDFITEITQIPCLDNQISLLKSTFFEDVSYMALFFESKENIKLRGFNLVAQDDDLLGLLSENYGKCI